MEEEKLIENSVRIEEIEKKAKKEASRDNGLSMTLWKAVTAPYYNETIYAELWQRLVKLYGKSPVELETVEEFWNPQFSSAVACLVGEKYQADIEEITRMYTEGQFSNSMYRRSYRSKRFGYYAANIIQNLFCYWLYRVVYDESISEMLQYELGWLEERRLEAWIALELKRNNKETVELVKEAIVGDNQVISLSTTMIRAVIISGNQELLDLLLKLLVAARLQEGLRQQILENADAGSIHVLIKILKLCIEEDMFRYSSVIRAFDTWTGLGYSDAKQAVVKKCAGLAWECLTDEMKRSKYLNSNDNLEAYFAVWATACYEIDASNQMVEKLLKSEKKYRKVLGWYFVSHADNTYYQMKLAQQYLEERDEELLAFIVSNLSVTRELTYAYYYPGYADNINNSGIHGVVNRDLPKELEKRKELFRKLKELLQYIGNKKRSFSGNPFDFSYIELDSSRVIDCMLSIAGYDMNEDMMRELIYMFSDINEEQKSNLISYMNVEQRRAFYVHFMNPGKNTEHKKYLLDALQDRSVQIKELAVEKLSECELEDDDLLLISDGLRSKSSPLRKCILDILKKQPAEKLSSLLPKMLSSKEEYPIQAGIELLLEFKDKYPGFIQNHTTYLDKLMEKKLSTQTEILLRQLNGLNEEKSNNYTIENGFGLYDPDCIEKASGFMGDKTAKRGADNLGKQSGTDFGELFTAKKLKKMLILSKEEYFEIFNQMNSVFEKHADYEYTVLDYLGERTSVLFGDARNNIMIPEEYGNQRTEKTISMIPFSEEFLEVLGEYATDLEKMMCLCYMSVNWINDHFFGPKLHSMEWFKKIEQTGLTQAYHKEAFQMYGTRYWQMIEIIELLPKTQDSQKIFAFSYKVYQSMIALIGENNLGRSCINTESYPGYYYGCQREFAMNHRMIGYFRKLIQQSIRTLEEFKVWFCEEYRLERIIEKMMKQEYDSENNYNTYEIICSLTVEDYFHAYDEQIISKDILYHFLLCSCKAEEAIRMLTRTRKWEAAKKIFEKYPFAEDVVNQAVKRIVEVEEKRGEMQTPLTHLATVIERFEGAEYFVHLLAALGKENFYRGYYFSSNNTKQSVLSMLLKRCYPSKEDTPEILKSYIKETDINEKRLVEAVMYAPQWAGFAEKILGWQGLKCGVWFFHAHVNETFSAEKETEAAIYSPITPQQFNDGSFDKDWFFEAYGQLGEKHFLLLYKSAKYITSGSNQHRRSQLYTDAVLGKLDIHALEEEIAEKRNQEKLRCYSLIPIEDNQSEEALRRYEFIEQFRKESKQFGEQRRESEKKACDTAIQNLAITTGFMDVNRMMWYLESEKMKEILPYMKPVEVEEGICVNLVFLEDGTAELAVIKNGKTLKTLPKSLKKQEYVLKLKEKIKELKEQRRRAKVSLERAMVERTEFGQEELMRICSNPVLYPIIQYLVWTDGSQMGFLCPDEKNILLEDVMGGNSEVIKKSSILRIAHPYDLIEAGKWAGYMHYLYENKVVQPFKQVFREYYRVTEDEIQEKNISRRYAGYQVQQQKAIALLRGCGWTVDYEEGLQKVLYKENLIARVYAMADWFSPADIESPTLEVIQFYDRKTGDIVDFADVPPIAFSETMRDIDLIVSVAHVGGVDPEASQSTIEMRIAIAKEFVQLLRLQNVSFMKNHAKIHGKLANYSVHMGSGIVHAEAVGMIAILPVHSQARGRIFLPFADDDPKTAEIMSKIILLAEDEKIKDTSILGQIKGTV